MPRKHSNRQCETKVMRRVFANSPLALFMVFILIASVGYGQDEPKWEEIFDAPEAPAGWRVINNDGSSDAVDTLAESFAYVDVAQFVDVNGVEVASVTAQAGSHFWFSNFEGANSNGLIDEWLISPVLAGIEPGDELSFYAGAPDGVYKDTLRVYVSTTDSALQSFTSLIDSFKVDGPVEEYHLYTFDLSGFAGADIFIAVNYLIEDGGLTGKNSDAVWVDHFSITRQVTSVASSAIPQQFELLQNYPNPFNPSTQIAFSLPRASDVTLKVFNILGQEVAVPLEGEQLPAGRHKLTYDARGLSNGIYYYQIQAGEFSAIKKMTLLR